MTYQDNGYIFDNYILTSSDAAILESGWTP